MEPECRAATKPRRRVPLNHWIIEPLNHWITEPLKKGGPMGPDGVWEGVWATYEKPMKNLVKTYKTPWKPMKTYENRMPPLTRRTDRRIYILHFLAHAKPSCPCNFASSGRIIHWFSWLCLDIQGIVGMSRISGTFQEFLEFLGFHGNSKNSWKWETSARTVEIWPGMFRYCLIVLDLLQGLQLGVVLTVIEDYRLKTNRFQGIVSIIHVAILVSGGGPPLH